MAPRSTAIVMLAETFDWSMDPKGWLMSEKLDGRRATWRDGRLVSRYGNRIAAPAWFTEPLKALGKDARLDGELWLGRGTYERLSSVVTVATDRYWKDMAYVCFDWADATAGVYAERLRRVEKEIGALGCKHVRALPHIACEGREHAREALDRIVKAGGEGLMFRQPESPYVEGRGPYMLKLPNRPTMEAEVVGYEESNRMPGLVGALVCRLETGIIFEIGTGLSMEQRGAERPPVGAMVTFSFKNLLRNRIPREPSFIAVREMPKKKRGKPGPVKTKARERRAKAG